MNILKINTNAVFCVGDIHGNFESIIGQIKRYDLTDSAILFCGDIAFGFNKPDYYNQIIGKIRKECKKRNVYILFIRGNHDDPSYFNGNLFKRGFVQTVADYTVVQFYPMSDPEKTLAPTFSFLCVGGATSVDRTDRIARMEQFAREYMRYHHGLDFDEAYRRCQQLYWVDEQPFFSQEAFDEIKERGIVIDNVCTHTCPSFCQPTTKDGILGWAKRDERLLTDVDHERDVMDKIYNQLVLDEHHINGWYYGHYHYHHFDCIDGVKYYMLDMDHHGNFDMIEVH